MSRIRASRPLPDPFAKPPAPIPPAPAPLPRSELEQIAAFPARLVAQLPVATVLVCQHVETLRGFWVATSRPHWEAARAAQWPVMHGRDFDSCIVAARARAACLAIDQWLTPRQPPPRAPESPDWLILGTLQGLLSPEAEDVTLAADCELSVGDVLTHFRCRLVGIDPALEALAPSDARLM